MFSQLLKVPNLLSLYRLILSFIIPILWIKKVNATILYFLIITGVLSDTLDGNLARLLKQKTSLGKILDPLADKFFINMLFFLFWWEKRIALSFFLVILSRDLLILLGALYLSKKGLPLRDLNPTILGKISTIFQLLSLVFLFSETFLRTSVFIPLEVILRLTLFFTLASGFHYFIIFQRLSKGYATKQS